MSDCVQPGDMRAIARSVAAALGIEAAVVVGIELKEFKPTEGYIDSLVHAGAASQSGVGPHYHQLAAGLRRVADDLERDALRAGYNPTARVITDLNKPGGSA